jgi:hypothetical protein
MTGNQFTRSGGGQGRLGLLAAAAAGLVALAVLTVVAGPPHPATPEAAPPATAEASPAAGAAAPDPQVDLADAEQVCAAFAAALFTTAAGDDSPREVYRRAAAYATGELAAALVADQGRLPVPQPPPAPRGVDVTGYVGDHMRPDTEGGAYRAALVTVTSHDGSTARHVVYCTLQPEAGRWLVAAYEQERSLP